MMHDLDKQISLRTNYQLKVANILSQNPNLSSYFALKAIDSKFSSSCNTNLNTNIANSVNGTEKECKDSKIDSSHLEFHFNFNPSSNLGSEFLCPYCGLHLSPGHFQTSVRIRNLHRGPTRRRRASRHQAYCIDIVNNSSNPRSARKQYNTKEWKSILSFSPSEENRPNHYEKEQYEVNQKLEYRSKRVTDGEAKNCVVYTCGRCGEKLKFKGVPMSTKKKQKEQLQNMKLEQQGNNNINIATPSSSKSAKHSTNNNLFHIKTKHMISVQPVPKKQELKEQQKKLGSAFVGHSFASKDLSCTKFHSATINSNSLSGNFIPIGSKSKNKSESPLLKSTKKKRKRGKTDVGRHDGKGKKSQLMDFLASLND